MSLVIIKPDAIRRKLLGPLFAEYDHQFQIIRAEMRKPPELFWRDHYREHVDKPFWPGLLAHMVSGRVMAMIIGADTVEVRDFTLNLRLRYGADKEGPANLLHSSTVKDVFREMDLWFPGGLK